MLFPKDKVECDYIERYYTQEMFQLNKVKAIEEDTNPWEQHGFLPVCKCGYVFSRDKWHIADTLTVMTELGPVDITVSGGSGAGSQRGPK